MLRLVVNLRKTHLWSWAGSTGSRKVIGEAKLVLHNAGFQPGKTVTHLRVTIILNGKSTSRSSEANVLQTLSVPRPTLGCEKEAILCTDIATY